VRVREALYLIFTAPGRLWRRCSDVSGAIHAAFKIQRRRVRDLTPRQITIRINIQTRVANPPGD
jgi:hypothetical protein